MSVKVENITNYYGEQLALNSVSFTLKKGEIVGFLGPNGAGKSTLMKIITGYIENYQGDVWINNNNVRLAKLAAQKCIGYLPENNPLYLEMYVKEYLKFNAAVYGVSNKAINEMIEKVGLTKEQHKKIHELSKGYRQRVGLAAALLHNPEVIILDEPTTGLDPNQLVEIRNLIKELGVAKTILFSTHILQEVEAVCDRVLIINKGNLVADEYIKQLNFKNSQVIEIEFELPVAKQVLEKIPQIKLVKHKNDLLWELHFDTAEDMRATVFDFAYSNKLKILQLSAKKIDLAYLFNFYTT